MDFWILNIFLDSVRSLPQMITEPTFLVVTAIVLFLVYRQYLNIAEQKQRMYGAVGQDPRWQTLRALGYGILVGSWRLYYSLSLASPSPMQGLSMFGLWLSF